MTVFASECTRINLRECNFQKFPGGACPQTPLEWACFACQFCFAKLYMHSYFLVTPPLRNPVSAPVIHTLTNSLPADKDSLNIYRQAQASDEICSNLIAYCRSGWPSHKPKGELRKYWNFQGEMS